MYPVLIYKLVLRILNVLDGRNVQSVRFATVQFPLPWKRHGTRMERVLEQF